MTYYEIKKVFSKKGSKVALIFIFIVISVVLSFIIGDNKYVNHNGDAESGIGLVQEIYGTKVNKGICCVFCYNNLPAKNVLPEYVCDYKKRAGLFQRSADLE